MSTNPNTVKSQDELNEGGRKSDVLVEAISKLETTTKENELLKEIIKDEMIKNGEILEEIERLQKQLDIAVKALEDYAESDNWELENEKYIYWAKKGQPYPWRLGIKALKEIEELNR